MRKPFCLILALALLPVLAGCRIDQPANRPSAPSAPSATTQTTAADLLTREEAIRIALQDAGLTQDRVYDLEAELDRDGILHYDVDFEAGGYDYDYEIDAATGKILHSQKERD